MSLGRAVTFHTHTETLPLFFFLSKSQPIYLISLKVKKVGLLFRLLSTVHPFQAKLFK